MLQVRQAADASDESGFGKYTNMSEKERQDYADAWLYIHRKKEK